jgi:cyanophycinase
VAVHLIGGGRDDDGIRASHAGFVRAAGGRPIVAIVLDEGEDTDPERWIAALGLAGAADVRTVTVSPERPPCRHDLDGAGGVFVAGGWTPGYHAALVGHDWLVPGLPYAGFSAGAAVAGRWAILGGWRHDGLEVCPEDAAEDLEELTVRPGLGLVPFAVDVHATRWGTLPRLVHAVRAGLAPEGWAIDEGTALVYDGNVRVEGLGAAYGVKGERLTVAQAIRPR